MLECIHCGGDIEEIDGVFYHARIEDFSHLPRPVTQECRGCGSEEHALSDTLKCPDCVAVDVHNYRALHDGRMKTRPYPTPKEV